MKILPMEKVKVLAEKNGWSNSRAEGYVDGEIFRRRGKTPSKYVQIGIDEYCLGFRAGYYERQEAARPIRVGLASTSELPVARLPFRQPRESGDMALQSRMISEQGG